MQTMWSVYGMLTLIFLTIVVGWGAMILVMRPNPNKSTEGLLIKLALKNLGVQQLAWKTLVVTASRDVKLDPDALWDTWSQIEDWPAWSTMHASARWIGDAAWQPGATFEQVLDLGFPLGRRSSRETIAEITPGRRVRWIKNHKGVKSCHIWSFAMLPNRQMRISNTQVFHGTLMGLLKPALTFQWQKRFEKSLDKLIERTREASAASQPAVVETQPA